MVKLSAENKKQLKRRGFSLREFVTSCSTCMGKEGMLGDDVKPYAPQNKEEKQKN